MSYIPYLDDFELELIGSVDTGVEKAVVEYEIPFAAGGILDDMGVKARRFQIRTIWRTAGVGYDPHREFIEHAQIDQVNTFVHPELGPIKGRVKSVNVIHDSRVRCAEINIDFLEDANPDVQPAYNPPIEARMEEAVAEVMAALTESMAAEFAAAGVDTDSPVDLDKPIAGQLKSRWFSVLMFLAKLAKAINDIKAAYNKIKNAIDSAVAMINFVASLPGQVVGGIARAVERAAMAARAVANAPKLFLSSLRSSVKQLANAIPMLGKSIRMVGASIAALFTGKIFAADESAKAVLRRIEDTPQWNPDGTPLELPPAPPVLTAEELEESLAIAREMIQEGIAAAREAGDSAVAAVLARQADELTQYVTEVKLERDRIVTVEVEPGTPLHLICLRYGLPYSYADRIATINGFYNPTFCAGGVRLYERHS